VEVKNSIEQIARMALRRLIFLIVVIPFSTVIGVAATPQEQDLSANARKEKTVNLYTSIDARESRQIADLFQQR
jgi:hypothetical protein